MSRRGVIGYLALAALLGVVWLVATRMQARKAEETARGRRIFAWSAADVRAVRIRRAADPEVTLERRKHWQITAPIDAAADREAVDDLLQTAEKAQREREVEQKPSGPDAYGLGTPVLRVSFRAGERWDALDIGADTFSSAARYARLEGRPGIFLVSQADYNRLDKPLDALRERRLLPSDKSSLRGIVLERDGARISLRRTAGGWTIDGFGRPVRDTKADDLFTILTDTKVTKFVSDKSDALSPYGLDRPDMRATLDFGSAKAWVALAPAPKESSDAGVYAARSDEPGVVLLPADFISRMPAAPRDLEDRRLFTGDPAKAERVSIATGKKTIAFRRKGSVWEREGPVPAGAPGRPDLDGLLDFLQTNEHDGAPEGTAPAPPASTAITIAPAGGAPLMTLTFDPSTTAAAASTGRLTDSHGTREVALSAATLGSLASHLRQLDPPAPTGTDGPSSASPAK